MNSFEIQCSREGLRKDNACLSTKIQSQIDKTIDFIVKTDLRLGAKIVPSTSCAPFDMQWSSL